MMQLTDAERDAAVQTLRACGIEGEDLATGLEVVCKLAESESLDTFVESARDMSLDEITAAYGHDASRHVWVLRNRHGRSDR